MREVVFIQDPMHAAGVVRLVAAGHEVIPPEAGAEDPRLSRASIDITRTRDLIGLGDKRVAVIGTGASAIQIVRYVGRDAKQLYVFQRTPSSVERDVTYQHPLTLDETPADRWSDGKPRCAHSTPRPQGN